MNIGETSDTEEMNAMTSATRVLAEARARCAELGLDPGKLASLFLPEALLAMMVAGMSQEEAEEVFARFAREEIPAWYLQVRRTAGYCECEQEARGEHLAACAYRDVRSASGRRPFDRIREGMVAGK